LKQDFGSVKQGTVLEACFPVRNTGSRRLVLLEANAGCCGQGGETRPTTVAPGASAQLTVRVDTSNWHGRLDERVGYTTNDPNCPRLVLQIQAHVQ
jgi:hypothetical protein